MKKVYSCFWIAIWIAFSVIFISCGNVQAWSLFVLKDLWNHRLHGSTLFKTLRSQKQCFTALYSHQVDTALLVSRIANLTENVSSTLVDRRRNSSSSRSLTTTARLPQSKNPNWKRTKSTADRQRRNLPSTNSQQSLENAIEQVHALFDFSQRYDQWDNDHKMGSIAIQALESLCTRILQNTKDTPSKQPMQRKLSKLVLTEVQLAKLHHLFLRVREVRAVPTLKTLESLWMIFKQHWRTPPLSSSSPRNETLPMMKFPRPLESFQRSTCLLQLWIQWSSNTNQTNPLTGQSPSTLYFLQLLRLVADNCGMPLTEDLWKLYRAYYVSQWQIPQRRPNQYLREVFALMIQILSYSEQPWRTKQCRVLQDMVLLRDNNLQPSEMELLSAIREAAALGRFNETAWICRQTNSSKVRSYFVPSLLHCKQPGSLLYMEKYVMLEVHHCDSNTRIEMIKMLLQKYSMDGDNPLSGRRAERIFRQLCNHTASTQWQLDYECMQFVVNAYLQPLQHDQSKPVQLKHVRAADRFLRYCVTIFGVHHVSHSSTISTSCRVFSNVLQAYAQLCVGDTSALTLKHCDEIFRFFLIHNKRGHITAEIPSQVHFAQMIDLWSRSSESCAKDKIAEYTFLSDHFSEKGS